MGAGIDVVGVGDVGDIGGECMCCGNDVDDGMESAGAATAQVSQ